LASQGRKPAVAVVVVAALVVLLGATRPAIADGSGAGAAAAGAGSAGAGSGARSAGAGAGSGAGSGSVIAADGSAAPLRRPLAVVATGSAADPALADLANRLASDLIRNDQLEPVPDSTAVALREPFADEDIAPLADARTNLTAAQDEVAAFQFADAARSAMRAEEALLSASPRAAAELRGELRVVHGIALLADRPGDAAAEFALAQRLAPGLALDPGRYLPEVVDAFAAARARAPTEERAIDVTGTGRVWIDGRDAGTAPGRFSVTVGLHVVQLVGPARLTRGREVDVRPAPAALGSIAIDAADASLAVRIHRARAALAAAADPLARAGAMTALADLVAVDDALVLARDSAGALVYDVWRRSAGFAARGPRAVAGEPAKKLLDIVAPPRPKPIAKRIYTIPFVPPPPRWKEPRYYLLGGLAAVLVGTGIYLIATHQGNVGLSDNLGTNSSWSMVGEPGGQPGARRR
jgi:hypothetical protein